MDKIYDLIGITIFVSIGVGIILGSIGFLQLLENLYENKIKRKIK